MRVLFLLDYLQQSGSVSSVQGLAKGLRAQNHDVMVIAFGGPRMDEFKNNNVPVRKVKPFRVTFSFFRRFGRTMETVRTFKPDIIQVDTPALLKAAFKMAGLLQVPLVFTVHKYVKPSDFLPAKQMEGVKIVTVSQALRAYLVNKVKLQKERISIIRDGIDFSLYPPAQLAAEGSLPCMGMCGNYQPDSGHGCFLKAIKTVVEKQREALFFVAGYGPGEPRVKKQARELGVYRHIQFIHDFPDVRKVLALYDVFVLPSLREGLGYRALEAMAMAKPVVASSVGGLMDVVRDEETGLLFQPDDPDKLASKIEHFLDHPEDLVRMGQAGQNVVKEEFSVEQTVAQMVNVYEGLLA